MSNQLRLNGNQIATLLVFEGQIAALQNAANQLGGAMRLKAEADVLVEAREVLIHALGEFQRAWANGIVIAQPGDVPKPMVVAP